MTVRSVTHKVPSLVSNPSFDYFHEPPHSINGNLVGLVKKVEYLDNLLENLINVISLINYIQLLSTYRSRSVYRLDSETGGPIWMKFLGNVQISLMSVHVKFGTDQHN